MMPGAYTCARPGYAYAQAHAYAYPPPPPPGHTRTLHKATLTRVLLRHTPAGSEFLLLDQLLVGSCSKMHT
jgi:hypothetical protein